nr:MAG TPA: hypothetical protein [Caudoviricetes sp.]
MYSVYDNLPLVIVTSAPVLSSARHYDINFRVLHDPWHSSCLYR